MARTIAALSAGARLSDYISRGVLRKTISPALVLRSEVAEGNFGHFAE